MCVEDSWPLMSGYIQAVDLEETWAKYCLFAFFFFFLIFHACAFLGFIILHLCYFDFFFFEFQNVLFHRPPPFKIYSFSCVDLCGMWTSLWLWLGLRCHGAWGMSVL